MVWDQLYFTITAMKPSGLLVTIWRKDRRKDQKLSEWMGKCLHCCQPSRLTPKMVDHGSLAKYGDCTTYVPLWWYGQYAYTNVLLRSEFIWCRARLNYIIRSRALITSPPALINGFIAVIVKYREVKKFSTKTSRDVGMVPSVSKEHMCLHGKINWQKSFRNKEGYHSMLNNPG